MALIETLGLLALLLFSIHGWGWGCRRAFRMTRGSWIVTATLGLAAVVFAGGILNLARLAWRGSLIGLMLIGLVLLVLAIKQRFCGFSNIIANSRSTFVSHKWNILTVTMISVVVTSFTIWTQLPPRAYNYHDDFQKYFAHPIRMLETGTLFGSPLSALGSETLGGQAFIQAFPVSVVPISYINSADAVFGLFICLMLSSVYTIRAERLVLATAASMLAVIFIDPQFVNVSSLYLGGAVIMALIALSADPRELAGDAAGGGPNPAAMGLLYAALIAMKTTFALFVVLHLAAVAVVVYCGGRDFRPALRFGLFSALFTAVFISPWILLYAPYYLVALHAPPVVLDAARQTESLNLFSLRPLFYGSTFANYTGLMAAVAVGGIAAVWAVARSADDHLRLSAWATAAAAVAGVAAYLVLIVVFGPLVAGYESSIRYFTPFAIGVVPAVLGLTAFHMVRSGRTVPRAVRLGLPLVIALPVLAFWPSLRVRADQALTVGSVLAFSKTARNPIYLGYNRWVLQGPGSESVWKIQQVVPAGEPIIAWINAPFYLDFARNPITDVELAGLASPWAVMPPARYVIWQYRGIATPPMAVYEKEVHKFALRVRRIAKEALTFTSELRAMIRGSEVLYNDGQVAVFRLPEATP